MMSKSMERRLDRLDARTPGSPRHARTHVIALPAGVKGARPIADELLIAAGHAPTGEHDLMVFVADRVEAGGRLPPQPPPHLISTQPMRPDGWGLA
jgi:hypothetical protein